ncbi:MAG TPA: ion channel [Sphingomicrobium sp.]|jgi:inward rectifier potassium channel|nr:ion channel [Sphingomicrobium sp.]
MAQQKRSPQPLVRLIKNDQRMKVRRIGGRSTLADFYHAMLHAKWRTLFGLFALSFILFNLVFALLYWSDASGIDWGRRRIDGGPFWRAFEFSVDTMTTVGYGNMAPISVFTNVVSTIELALGVLFVALATGIAFARFSRPTARMLFSNVAVIAPFEGVPTLMLRCANERHNLVFEAHAMMSLIVDEETESGTMRRFHDLKLVRAKNPVFTLTWTIMHAIDEDSPLKPWLDQQSAPPASDIIVVVSGTDDRTGHTMYSRWAYGAGDLRWNARFADILSRDADGIRTIDYRCFNDVTPIKRVNG